MRLGDLSAGQRALLDAMLIDEGVAAAPRIPRRDGDRGRAPLTAGQEAIYFLERLRPGSAAYTIAGAVRLTGDFDPAGLWQALRLVVERHEALRTGFRESADGEPEQFVVRDVHVDLDERTLDLAEDVDRVVRELAARPFDLGEPPLLRATLVRSPGAGDALLVLCVHHLVIDGGSLPIVLEDLATAWRTGAVAAPATAVEFGDVAAWQRQWLDSDEHARQLADWVRRLDGAAPAALLTDHPRTPETSAASAWCPVTIPADVVAGLHRLAEGERATLFMALLAAWSVVLARWSGSEDLVIGAPVAGRTVAETERMVGFFVNTLPLRVDASGDPTFRELLGRVRDVAYDGYERQSVPLERILRTLRRSGGDLIRHALTLHTIRPARLSLPGVEAEPVPVHTGAGRFELELQLEPTADGSLTGRLEYATDLFEPASADGFAAALGLVLAGVVADASQRLSRL
ncbi:condensation domain-containing protein, partial [Micromonospora sp. DT229]|uniref:condensation domain-containing protein n=1 Tax=Micromonospora sp. DT229 TaxID=3393430 RepID=UPI003CEFB657